MEGWSGHGSMVVASDFVQISLGMSNQLHHPCEISILVISTIEFLLTVATDKNKWRTVFTYPIEWRILVDGGLQGIDALHLAHIIVCNRLSAEGNKSSHFIGIDTIDRQP